MEWLPVINIHIPASGITFLNAFEMQFRVWRAYRDAAELIVKERIKESESRRG